MSGEIRLPRERYGEAFWRAHHEAWRRSELNQREYCEAQRIPLKAFGNWRAKFKAEPQAQERKLLYRRRSLSHILSHSLSHRLSHMTYGSPVPGPIVPPAREGHRRRFNEADEPCHLSNAEIGTYGGTFSRRHQRHLHRHRLHRHHGGFERQVRRHQCDKLYQTAMMVTLRPTAIS